MVNSRELAEKFEKEHRNVLRDIDALLPRSNLSAADISTTYEDNQPQTLAAIGDHETPEDDISGWFRLAPYLDENGVSRRSFDITRDGFSLLVMGWNGELPMG